MEASILSTGTSRWIQTQETGVFGEDLRFFPAQAGGTDAHRPQQEGLLEHNCRSRGTKRIF
jgi:hypothetical protein